MKSRRGFYRMSIANGHAGFEAMMCGGRISCGEFMPLEESESWEGEEPMTLLITSLGR